ncbi:hypothetical protein [Hymenobacter sp. CRA2]|uniref:hypothetical protein n=1 Tax=Hymenobacter sp. CRA2 TaxID=1955620 RepID=UPI00098FD94E|nr:hypothetical protein [Hymenobacter sp. CRA2]OON68238.1 hypothetical protein B0919_13865 [Hymenobacter sp. CRA2]
MRRSLLILSALAFPALSFAQSTFFQPGYIVRTGAPNDTVRGYLDAYHATRRVGFVRFRPSLDAPAETLRARDLAAAGTADRRQAFRTRMVNGDSLRILELITAGPLNLYTGYSPRSDVDFMIEQTGGELLPLSRAQYEPVLKGVLAGCPSLTTDNSQPRLHYARVSLGRRIDRYNRCQPDVSARYFPGSKQRTELSIRVGSQRSQFWSVYKNQDFGFKKPAPATDITGAVQLAVPIGGSLKAVVEASYSRARSFTQVHDMPRAATNYFTRSIDLQAQLLQVPIMLRWQLGRDAQRVRPYLEGGGGLSMVLSHRAWYSEIPDVPTDRPDAYELGMSPVTGFSRGGAGVVCRTPIGNVGVAFHTQRLSTSSPNEKSYSYRLRQSDLSLTYAW